MRTLIASGFIAILAVGCAGQPDPVTHSDEPRGTNYSATIAATVLRQGNYAQAASLADAAIASDKVDTHARKFAYGVRAAASLHSGHYEQASQDLDAIGRLERAVPPADLAAGDAALSAHPDRPEAYFARAKLYLAAGQYPLAISDCDIGVGLKLAQAGSGARSHAAWSSFDEGRFQQVIDDLGDNSMKLDGQPYSILVLHLARAKLGRDDRQEMARAVDAAGLTEWPAPVLDFYLGRIDQRQLFAAAGDGPDYRTREGQRCEANFYSGEEANLHGDKDDARDLLEAAMNHCPAGFFESTAAGAEHGRLVK
jgi:lipoprotein NlpI